MTSSTAAADSCVRIRIVDDQASVRDSLAFMLRQEGFECVCYESAKEFLIDDMPSVPGCLLLDVQMPQMSGLELQQELIRRGSSLPIVFLSAYGTIDMAVDTMQKGAVAFVEKPLTAPGFLMRFTKRSSKTKAPCRRPRFSLHAGRP